MSWRLIVIILLAIMAYNGCDGLRVNNEIKEYSIETIENDGIGKNRYIKIINGYTEGGYVYSHFESSENKIESVIFPMLSEEKLIEYSEGKNITVSVLVKRSKIKYQDSCHKENTCLDDLIEQFDQGGFSVKGITQVGLNDVDDKTKELLQQFNFKIEEKVLFIEEDSEPQSSLKSFLMLIGGVLGIIILISKYFKSYDSID